jgi:hypothetical protein
MRLLITQMNLSAMQYMPGNVRETTNVPLLLETHGSYRGMFGFAIGGFQGFAAAAGFKSAWARSCNVTIQPMIGAGC